MLYPALLVLYDLHESSADLVDNREKNCFIARACRQMHGSLVVLNWCSKMRNDGSDIRSVSESPSDLHSR